MRAILVGTADDRARLRSQLEADSIAIVAEFSSLADARRADIAADAIVMSADQRDLIAVPLDEPLDEEAPDVEPLTPRERDVLALLAEGRSNKSIADALGISDQTVKFHVASITGKLGAANRTEAVRRAVRRGLIVL